MRPKLTDDEFWRLLNERLSHEQFCEKLTVRPSFGSELTITGPVSVSDNHPCWDAIRRIGQQLRQEFELATETLDTPFWRSGS